MASTRDQIVALLDKAEAEKAQRSAVLVQSHLPCDPNARQWLLDLWRLLDRPSQISAVAEIKRLQRFERDVRAAAEVE